MSEVKKTLSVADTLAAARELKRHAGELRPLKGALLASFTAEPLAPFLEVEAAARGFALDLHVAPLNTVHRELRDPSSASSRAEAVWVFELLADVSPRIAESFLDLGPGEDDAEAGRVVSELESSLKAFRARSGAPVLWANFPRPLPALLGLGEAGEERSQTEAVRTLNRRIAAGLRRAGSAYPLDLDRIVHEIGWKSAHSSRAWYMGRSPFAPEALRRIAREAVDSLAALLLPPRKCLVVDLDGTLWGGIVGEDGAGGVRIGGAYPGNVYVDFQKYLRNLSRRGVILAIASRNNEADAREVFASRPEMALSLDDFASVRIGWEPKPENLARIASELGIGVDSLVFFDDSASERSLMRHALPEVLTIEVPGDPSGYVAALEESRPFDKLAYTGEDRGRARMYREEGERERAKLASGSMEEYLRDLATVVDIRPLDDLSFQRAEDLLQRTNQFNLTTRRHGGDALRRLAAAPGGGAFVLEASDRFGSNGIVGLAIVAPGESPRDRVLESFLVSCRVIGRGIETAFLAWIAEWCRAAGCRRLAGEFVPTPKNAVAAGFLAEHGFKGGWLDLAGGGPAWPAHVRKRERA